MWLLKNLWKRWGKYNSIKKKEDTSLKKKKSSRLKKYPIKKQQMTGTHFNLQEWKNVSKSIYYDMEKSNKQVINQKRKS